MNGEGDCLSMQNGSRLLRLLNCAGPFVLTGAMAGDEWLLD